MNLVGGDFGKEIAIGPPARDPGVVVAFVEIPIAAYVDRCRVRLQRARDYTRLPLQQLADLGGGSVGDVPGAIDRLIECGLGRDAGDSEFAIVYVDVGEIGDMQ